MHIRKNSMIPNVIHFIWLTKNSSPFAFFHYLAIKSAYDCNKPEAIKFYYKYEPMGEWWDKSKPFLTLIKVEPPTAIFGNQVLHYAHQADVIRLEVLIKEGGIYLDLDVVCFNSFTPLLHHDCVMGREGNKGLCNAVILAKPNAQFLKEWYDKYHNFNSSQWGAHSVVLPLRLALSNPGIIHVENRYAFFWPLYYAPEILFDEPSKRTTFRSKMRHRIEELILNQSYCVHLWNQVWGEEYLSRLTPEYLQTSQSIFSNICRKFLKESTHKKIIQNKYRVLVPALIRLNSIKSRLSRIVKSLSNCKKRA